MKKLNFEKEKKFEKKFEKFWKKSKKMRKKNNFFQTSNCLRISSFGFFCLNQSAKRI